MNDSRLLGNATDISMEAELESVDGQAGASAHPIADVREARVGVWTVDQGELTGQTKDEIFVVLFGSATITFHATGEVLKVGPSDIVRLRAGEMTSWVVHERLGKVYTNDPG